MHFSLSFAAAAAAALYFLTVNAAKSFIPFGHFKRQLQDWWSTEVEEAVSERRKVFAGAHRSNENRQAYISTSQRASSVIPKAKAEDGRRLAYLSHLNLTLNLCTLSFVLSLALPPFLTSQAVQEVGFNFSGCLRCHFSVPQSKVLRSRSKGQLPELRPG